MKFHNPTDRTQRFEIGRNSYIVPPAGEVEIPEQFAYVIRHRNMTLRPGPAPAIEGVAPTAASVLEAIPEGVELLLASPHILAEQREDLRRRYRASRGTARQLFVTNLQLLSQGRRAGDDPDETPMPEVGAAAGDAESGAAPEVTDAEIAETADVDAQITAAAQTARARKARPS